MKRSVIPPQPAAASGLYGALTLLLLLAACRLGYEIGARDSIRKPTGGQRASWTVLVYMSADNELESFALQDLNAIESLDLAGTGIRIVTLLDRAPGYDTSDGDWTSTRLYEAIHDPDGLNATIISRRLACPELGLTETGDEELDLGDPAVLRGFLAFGERAYPADHRALVFWGHGSGWRSFSTLPAAPTSLDSTLAPEEPRAFIGVSFPRGVGVDVSNGEDLLTTSEMGSALVGRWFDLIGFDTCSTAMIEVARELSGRGTLMVASEDLVSAAGWDYIDTLARFSASPMEPTDLAEAIVASYAERNADSAVATISALRLAGVPGIMAAFNDLCDQAWAGIIDAAVQTDLRRAIFEETEAFYATPGDLNVDLSDLAAVIAGRMAGLSPSAERLEDAVAAAIVAEWHHPEGHPRAHGLSVHYVPLAADGTPIAHDLAYFRNAPAQGVPAFVSESSWVPVYPAGPGLLYRIWYESLSEKEHS